MFERQCKMSWSTSRYPQFDDVEDSDSSSTMNVDTRSPSPLHIFPPVSFMRGAYQNGEQRMSCGTSSSPPSSSEDSSSICRTSPTTLTRGRRDGAMRLENILNEVSVDPLSSLWATSSRRANYRMQSICVPSECGGSEDGESECNSNNNIAIKSKRVHRCSECGKSFPRPSGLKTHMSTHTKEKPFDCTHPGCNRTFSVASNARRHMRLHGIGLDSASPEASSSLEINFEEPIVVQCQNDCATRSDGHRKLKWSSSRLKTSTL